MPQTWTVSILLSFETLQAFTNSIITSPRLTMTSWILTNSTNYAANGSLFIGQVLTDPMYPGSFLLFGRPRTLPQFLHVDETTATNYTLESHNLLQHNGGFWRRSQDSVVDISTEGDSRDISSTIWKVKRMVQKFTAFNMDYVKNVVLEEQDIKRHVKTRLRPIPPTLYIITGVCIFVGAKRADKIAGPFHEMTDFVRAYTCNRVNYFPWIRMAHFNTGKTAGASSHRNGWHRRMIRSRFSRWGSTIGNCNPVDAAGFGADGEADDVAHARYRLGFSSTGLRRRLGGRGKSRMFIYFKVIK